MQISHDALRVAVQPPLRQPYIITPSMKYIIYEIYDNEPSIDMQYAICKYSRSLQMYTFPFPSRRSIIVSIFQQE